MHAIITLLLAVLLAFAWAYSPTLFGAVACLLLFACLIFVFPEEEVDEDLETAEMREWVREEVRNVLRRSLRKHRAKPIEKALSAYEELYGKDDFYQEIWHEIYEEFYKEKECGQS